MLTVRLPSMLQQAAGEPVLVTPFVPDVGSLIEVLAARLPGFRQQMDDALFNVAINDELILHDVQARPLQDGDRVELVPTISGGCRW
jgi:molybdopterin converting factor small subunit